MRTTIDEQITSLEKSFLVITAVIVLTKNITKSNEIFNMEKKMDFVVIAGKNKCIILNRNALIERLFVPRRRFSLVIKPPRLSVNSKISLRLPSKKKKAPKKIAKK